MPWYPAAVRLPLNKPGRPKMAPVRINLHTAVTNAPTLHAYFSGPVAFSHFYVREDGTVEQYLDTALAARADLDGNPDTVSIETWDGYGKTWKQGQSVPPWTEAQVAALTQLIAWLFEAHPSIPKRLATDSKPGATSHGVSWHRIGIDGNFPALPDPRAGRVQRGGGMRYSNSAGKTCPGDARIAQIPAIFALAAGGVAPVAPPAPKPPAPAPKPKEWPEVALVVDGQRGALTVKAWQRHLAAQKVYKGAIDGSWGPVSVKAMQTWLKGFGYYRGVIDGREGLVTIKALQTLLQRAGLYRGVIDGIRGPLSVKAEQAYLNTKR